MHLSMVRFDVCLQNEIKQCCEASLKLDFNLCARQQQPNDYNQALWHNSIVRYRFYTGIKFQETFKCPIFNLLRVFSY